MSFKVIKKLKSQLQQLSFLFCANNPGTDNSAFLNKRDWKSALSQTVFAIFQSLTFFCVTPKNKFKNVFFWVNNFLDFFWINFHCMDKHSQNIFFHILQKNKINWVWNDMRVSKRWQNFWANHPFNVKRPDYTVLCWGLRHTLSYSCHWLLATQ